MSESVFGRVQGNLSVMDKPRLLLQGLVMVKIGLGFGVEKASLFDAYRWWRVPPVPHG